MRVVVPQNTHAAFVIEGESARALFEAIAGEPEARDCDGAPAQVKRAGNVQCTRRLDPPAYQCDFAIDLRGQTGEVGSAC